jgi:hypothetical protein
VAWRIARYPTVTLALDPFDAGEVQVRTVEPGRAKVTWQEVVGATTSDHNDEDEGSANGCDAVFV